MLVDSHCHLDRLDLAPYNGDLNKAITAAHDEGVDHMLCVAISLAKLPDVLGIAEQYEKVHASVGVHPLQDSDAEVTAEQLAELAQHPKVVAIGETGLDYFYDKERAAQQQTQFVKHMQAAKICRKPVIIHTRDAQQDTLDIIRSEGDPELAGVLHCFTESWEMAKQAMDMNYYISLSGIVTFKNATELREVAKQIPLDRLLIETDSPYLAPVPYRGKKNEPKYVAEVAKFLAELRGISVEELAQITRQNYFNLFNISAS
ncbi:Putative deoxyribonuclease YcfH [gamma proteobacterium IMCC2047]|nr:Putative deoxyribonuclease YcfH [gamma proteobacterium IMCC2047]